MGTRLRQVHDPHYMQNVAEDPEYEVVRARMEERLLAILTEQNDPRLIMEPDGRCRASLDHSLLLPVQR